MGFPAMRPDEEEDVPGALPASANAAPPLPQTPADEALLTPDSPVVNQPPPGAAAGLMQPGDIELTGGAPGATTPAENAAPPVATLPNGQVDTATESKRLLGQQGQNAADAEAAERKKGEAAVGVAQAESQGADAELLANQRAEREQAEALQKANANTQSWLDNYQQQASQFQKMGLHDYWQDKSTGDKVLAGLAMMFGAAAQNRPGGVGGENPGMKIIDNAIERDFRLQTANIEKKKHDVDFAKQGYEMGLTAKQQALADVNMKKASALDSAAAQLVSLKLKAGIPLAQATADANVVALREKANKTRLETVQAIHAQNVEDARLAIDQQRADAMTLRAEKYKTRGAGAGGGGGGGSAAATAYMKWRSQNPNATPEQQYAKADELHIPHVAKGSRESLKTLEDRVEAQRKADAATAKANGGDESKRTVTLDDGSKLALPTPKSVPDFVKGYASRVKAKQGLQRLLDDVKANGNVWTADKVARRDALMKDANIAVGSISSMGASDHSAHLEMGSLGPVAPRQNPIWGPSSDVAVKLLEDKIKELDEGTQRAIHAIRNDGTALAAGEEQGGGQEKAQPASQAGGDKAGKAAKAKAILADPQKRSLYNDKQLARLVQISMGM